MILMHRGRRKLSQGPAESSEVECLSLQWVERRSWGTANHGREWAMGRVEIGDVKERTAGPEVLAV